MSAHYTYFNHLTQDSNMQKLSLAVIIGSVLLLLGRALTRRLAQPAGVDSELIPSQGLTLFGFFDVLVEKFIDFHDSVLGKENRQHIPFTFSIFLFVFVANLLGLIPGMPVVTTTVWVNVALSVTVFLYFNYEGVRANGLLGYIKHFCGPVILLAPLIFPIEIFSTTLRILTLNLRLYWNITADHLVLDAFTELVPYGVPVIFYIFGTFVCFMQAFVFTVLTMVYILLATMHEESDEERSEAH